MGFKVLDKTKSKWLKKMNKSYSKIAAYTLIKWSDVFREYKQISYTELSLMIALICLVTIHDNENQRNGIQYICQLHDEW